MSYWYCYWYQLLLIQASFLRSVGVPHQNWLEGKGLRQSLRTRTGWAGYPLGLSCLQKYTRRKSSSHSAPPKKETIFYACSWTSNHGKSETCKISMAKTLPLENQSLTAQVFPAPIVCYRHKLLKPGIVERLKAQTWAAIWGNQNWYRKRKICDGRTIMNHPYLKHQNWIKLVDVGKKSCKIKIPWKS